MLRWWVGGHGRRHRCRHRHRHSIQESSLLALVAGAEATDGDELDMTGRIAQQRGAGEEGGEEDKDIPTVKNRGL